MIEKMMEENENKNAVYLLFFILAMKGMNQVKKDESCRRRDSEFPSKKKVVMQEKT
jgi:hypothetical protein